MAIRNMEGIGGSGICPFPSATYTAVIYIQKLKKKYSKYFSASVVFGELLRASVKHWDKVPAVTWPSFTLKENQLSKSSQTKKYI